MNEQEAIQLIKKFKNCTLPKEEWTHFAHLVAGLHTATAVSLEEGITQMRHNIRQYNLSIGGVNSDTSGYHETITQFFMVALHQFINQYQGYTFGELLGSLQQSVLMERPFMFQFYSKERLFSVTARRDWIEPDKQPLSQLAKINFARQNSLHENSS